MIGNEAVTFFLNSKLPEELLAHIWDLADIPKRGALTKDTFAVAMYLIRQRISGKELPQALPASLIPPSLRQSVPVPPPQPPILQQPQPSSAAQDLFGLDNAFGPSIAQEQSGSPAPAFMTGMQSPARALSPKIPTQSPKPMSPPLSTPLNRGGFQPQSSFGKGITSPPIENITPAQTFTPSITQRQSFTPAQPPSSFVPLAPVQVPMSSGSVFGDGDLLGDTDPEISQKLTAETAELANLSNQIGSLNNATKDLQSNKARAETELANVSQQKRDIEARLRQIRSLYDAEVVSVKAVESQLSTVRGELQKNRQEVTILEASLHALQAQHNEQRTALQKDQAENTGLKSRIAAIGEEIKQLRETLEKVKRDARQQRGMVAINKKQLSTSESEKEKIQGEIETEKKNMEALAGEMASSAQIHPPVQRDIMSPMGSERSTETNPFLRRNTGEAMSPPAASFSPPPTFSPPAFAPTQPFSAFHEGAFTDAFENAFATSTPEPAPFPPTQKPEARTPQQQTRESTVDQSTPPSIASALSPPLVARDFSYAESATSSLAVNPSRSAIGSINGDTSPSRVSEETPRKSTEVHTPGVVDTLESNESSPPRDGPVVSNVEEKEVKSDDETPTYPEPVQVDTHVSEHHGARSAEEITGPDIVQETLSRPPQEKDLEIPPSLEQTAKNMAIEKPAEPAEPAVKEEVKEEEDDSRAVSLPGGFPSESSDEGRESWVDLGDESKSLPSEQLAPEPTATTTTLPLNRSDPFAFESSSTSAPKAATKEDVDAAFSSFGSLTKKKEENGPFRKDFDSEFPPIEEFGGEESDSDDEPGGFGFNDNFAEKVKDTGDANGVAVAGKSVETPLQQTLPVAPVEPTKIPTPPTVVTPDPLAHLTDAPPPVPPKDAMPDESSAPPITPGQTPPPESAGKPPAYSEYRNMAETSSGSNDLSGLLPQRGEPHATSAPYTSPPAAPVFSIPPPFESPKPVSFSPPPAQETSAFSTTPSFTPSQSPLPPPAISTPQPTTSQGTTIPASPFALSSLAPAEKSMKPSQTFGAFDFSGLQDAAPLDDSADDPFRLSTRSDAFGEFDTTFDSNPVTPAKPATNTHTNGNKGFDDFGFDAPSDFGLTSQENTFSAAPATSTSEFDDVFASFDKPVSVPPPTLPPASLAPPQLPARQPSPPDHPDLKTLTGNRHTRIIG
jgi:epidermal growth factor receptor substrate 15